MPNKETALLIIHVRTVIQIAELQRTDSCKVEYWLKDGVHPTAAGHELIAREWLNTFFRHNRAYKIE